VTNIVPLNTEAHRSLRVHSRAAAEYGDSQRFVQVIVTEFPHLVLHYPILFSKDADTGAFYCGAMLGFDAGENLFLSEGKGQESYRPLNLQRMPFYTAGSDLAIDLDHPRVNTSKGQPLFDDKGVPTAYLESIMATFRDLRPGMEMTRQFIATLMQLKLVEPIDISLRFDDGSTRDLIDLYTVNQDALRELPDATVVELFRRGYLKLIYLVIASVKQIAVLGQKKNQRLLQGTEALAGRIT
jgi:SapC